MSRILQDRALDAIGGAVAEIEHIEASLSRRLVALRGELEVLRRTLTLSAPPDGGATEAADIAGLPAIAAAIAAEHGLTFSVLVGTARHRRVVRVRHAAALAMRRAGGTLTEIGAVLHKDHSTIANALRRAAVAERE